MIPEIHLINAGLAYRGQPVFSNINLHIPEGQCIALLGASGIGKTSLLKMMAGLSTAAETILGAIKTSNSIPLSQQIAYMAQQDLLLPWLNVFDNAALSLRLSKSSTLEKNRKLQLTHELLDAAGLGNFKDLFPHQLSGGMRQRVALVRTIVQEKPVVLLDEPFSALDTITRYHLQNLAAKMLRGKTMVMVTHDPAEALRLADKVYLLSGAPAKIQLLAEPKGPMPRNLCDHAIMQEQLFSQLAGECA